jgi:4-hydroxybenzoate polyprenyltransferase
MMTQTKLFLELVRFSHTLFALPFALAAMLVAAGGIPSFRIVLLILICMATARNSAMAFNRLVDAKLDAKNPRTAKRHLPAGKLSENQVLAFIVANGIAFVLGAAFLNHLAFACAIPVWFFLLSYSWWKRFSWACHGFLGLAIGMSPLGAWIAVRGEFALFPTLLGVLLALWITGFDIIYATQDEVSDREQGLHSIPVRFGTANALKIALGLHIGMLVVGLLIAVLFPLGWPWYVSLGACVAMLVYMHGFRKTNDLDRMNQDFFLANVAISVICLVGLALVVYLHGGADVRWLQ